LWDYLERRFLQKAIIDFYEETLKNSFLKMAKENVDFILT
jgi:hypothetical protein